MNGIPQPPPPFSLVVPTVYGQMIVNRHDINQTEALVRTGHAVDHAEIDLLRHMTPLLGPDFDVADIGANVGTYSLALAPVVGRGRVHAFEAQRIIFNMLAGSVALNGLTNVHCHHAAVGRAAGRIEIPQFDYSRPMNFGSVEFGPTQTEALDQERGADPDRIEFVPILPLDSLGLDNVRLVKIDVEGMEMDVLEGAAGTIARCRPVMLVEFTKCDAGALLRRIEGFGHKACIANGNFLCIPPHLRDHIPIP